MRTRKDKKAMNPPALTVHVSLSAETVSKIDRIAVEEKRTRINTIVVLLDRALASIVYPTSNNVNFKVRNNAASSKEGVTP